MELNSGATRAHDAQQPEGEIGEDDFFMDIGREDPPPPYEGPPIPQGDGHDARQVPELDEQAAIEALQIEMASKCCVRNIAQDITVQGLDTSVIYKYILKTMSEKRHYTRMLVPHPSGAPFDPPRTLGLPNIWQFHVQPDCLFKDHKKSLVVPQTDIVKPCLCCCGRGRRTCNTCAGSGMRPVISIIPVRPCYRCGASGNVTCHICAGRGQMRTYLRLDVQWTLHYSEANIKSSNWPITCNDKTLGKLTKGSSTKLFENEGIRVPPLVENPNVPNVLAMRSHEFLTNHAAASANQKIVIQHHAISVIPVTEVSYKKKEKSNKYYVYGADRKVIFEKRNDCTIL